LRTEKLVARHDPARIAVVRHATWLFSTVAVLALALMPSPVSGQRTARDDVVWHWFSVCAGGDSLVLEVRVDGKDVYTSAFPICKMRHGDIKPEPQQRLIAFRFDAAPRRFGTRNPSTEPQRITGNVWEARRQRDALRLGVSFATEHQVLMNTVHVARVDAAARSEYIRGLVITTRPVKRADRTPSTKRSKPAGGAE
jgi:hypothetical protein